MALYEPFGETVKIVDAPVSGNPAYPNTVIDKHGEVNPKAVLEVEIISTCPDTGQRFDVLIGKLRADGGINEVFDAVKAFMAGTDETKCTHHIWPYVVPADGIEKCVRCGAVMGKKVPDNEVTA